MVQDRSRKLLYPQEAIVGIWDWQIQAVFLSIFLQWTDDLFLSRSDHKKAVFAFVTNNKKPCCCHCICNHETTPQKDYHHHCSNSFYYFCLLIVNFLIVAVIHCCHSKKFCGLLFLGNQTIHFSFLSEKMDPFCVGDGGHGHWEKDFPSWISYSLCYHH